ARFNAPLEQATSASPEAIELLTLGYRRHLAGSAHEALPYYERALKTDPDFALAHAALAVVQLQEERPALAAASSQRAFELRERLPPPARCHVESSYCGGVMGQDDGSGGLVGRWVQPFPHALTARHNFSICLGLLGEPDRALGEAREAARLLPSPWTY